VREAGTTAGSLPHEGREEEFREGDVRLQEALEKLRTRVEEHLRGFEEGVDTALTVPIRRAFEASSETHLRLMDEAGLRQEGGGDGSEDPGKWENLRAYREGLRKEVLDPLRESLEKLESGRTAALRWEGFQNGLPGVVQGLPSQILRLEPEGLYGPREGDSFWTTSRKIGVRMGRRIRGALRGAIRIAGRALRRPATPESPRLQTVPLEALARHCLLTRCPFALEPFLEEIQQHFAVPLAGLAEGAFGWAREWYPAEEAVHTSESHLPKEVLERLEAHLASLEPPASPQEEDAGPEPKPGEGSREGGGGEPQAPSAVATSLQTLLETGASLSGPLETFQRMREAMTREWANLLEEVRVAGSFQEKGTREVAASRVKRLDARLQARAEEWSEWYEANMQRLGLVLALMRVREGWDRAQDQLLNLLAGEVVLPILEPWMQTRQELRRLEGEAEDLLSEERIGGSLEKAETVVAGLADRVSPLLETGFLEPMSQVQPVRVATSRADEVVGILSDTLRSTPSLLALSPTREAAERVNPAAEIREVPLREILLKTVDVVRLDTVRALPGAILEILGDARGKYEDIPEIASFNLSSARDELKNPPESTPAPEVLEETRSLVTDGLEHTGTALEGLMEGLPQAWVRFLRDSHDFFSRSFQEIHRRALAEGFVQEQILDLRSRVEGRIRESLDALRVRGQKLARILTRALRRLRARGIRLARLGRSAVGLPQHLEGEAERALEILRGSPKLLESLPLVYRKLFSFQPVSDPTLLTDREDIFDWLNRRLQAWQDGTGDPAILLGRAGSGHTSLLDVAGQTLFQDHPSLRLDLDFRPNGEGALVGWIWTALELGGHSPRTLNEMSDRLSSGQSGTPDRVILMEHLEHLVMRVPNGTGLLENFLSFQARTSARVFWLSTLPETTWKYLTRTEPAVATMVSAQVLPPPSRDFLERLIVTRHQRSGLALEFLEPAGLNPLLQRRLRKARGEKGRQAVLKEEFFDRLHRMSQGSIAMAILLWLRALDFTSQKGKVLVKPPHNVRFAFLEELDLQMDFSLMAFLDHGSLTLGEYARIFRTSSEEAWQVFEVLRARMLLEPLSKETSLPRALRTIDPATRYRIPPILGEVVSQRLRSHNILH